MVLGQIIYSAFIKHKHNSIHGANEWYYGLMLKQISLRSALLSLAFLALLAIFPTSAVGAIDETSSDEVICGEGNVTYYNGEATLPRKPYDVYIKLGLPGQTGVVSAYSPSNSCQLIGSVTASGDSWVRLGSFATNVASETSSFQLFSSVLKEIPDANRPTLFFLDANKPICQPGKNCELNYGNHPAHIRLTELTDNSSALTISTVIDPTSDQISSVKYYADSQLMYSRTTLEDFDLRYASYYKQKLTRVVEFRSGQAIVLEDIVPLDFHDSIPNMLLRFSVTNASIIVPLTWSLSLLVLFAIMHAIMHTLRAHEYYNYAHGLIHDPTGWHLKLQNLAYSPWYRRTAITGMVLTTSLIVVIATNSFALQIYTVNGVSMQQTLQDGDRLLVNKLPITFSKQYVPNRGEIVIVHPNFGSTPLLDEADSGTLVKRVIGLPGERVSINNGKITVYNHENPEGFDVDAGSRWESSMSLDETQDQIDIQLTENEIFICGDNRPESIDSRYNGAIDLKQIVGIVIK